MDGIRWISMTMSERILIMVKNKVVLKGRYWIRVSEFEEQDEIVDYFYDLDEKVNPDSVVTRARKEGRERLAQKKELEKQKKISKKLVKN